MKKFFALAAVAAMFIACGGEKPAPQPQPQPGVGDEVEFEGAISIDGQYADWDAVTENIQVATLPEGECRYSQLKTFKLHADENFIYVYCEFDPTNTLVFVPYFDLDSDATTGNTSKWDGAGYEAKAEGDIWTWTLDADENPVSQEAPKAWDPAFYEYTDEGTIEVCPASLGAVISSTPAPTKDGLYAFEAALVREILDDAYGLEGTFTMGMIQYDMDWMYIGQLPCQSEDARMEGALEEMLTVTLP